jgi:predicted AlkP superfamily pyrophosphatase or phosphodiesterase
MNRNLRSVSLVATLLLALTSAQHLSAGTGSGRSGSQSSSQGIQHVLLISIDGMHALDFINCANGISGANGGLPYCPNMAGLKPNGIDYLFAYTSQPSDSFPGLMALMTGGSPRSVGAFYDDAYDRSLDPPAVTTGDGLAAGTCLPYAEPSGTTPSTTRESTSTKRG